MQESQIWAACISSTIVFESFRFATLSFDENSKSALRIRHTPFWVMLLMRNRWQRKDNKSRVECQHRQVKRTLRMGCLRYLQGFLPVGLEMCRRSRKLQPVVPSEKRTPLKKSGDERGTTNLWELTTKRKSSRRATTPPRRPSMGRKRRWHRERERTVQRKRGKSERNLKCQLPAPRREVPFWLSKAIAVASRSLLE